MNGFTGTVEQQFKRDGSHKGFVHTVYDADGNVHDVRKSAHNRYGFAIAVQRKTGPVVCGYSRTAKAPGSKWQYGTVAFSVPLVDVSEALPEAPEPQTADEPHPSTEESPEVSRDLGEAIAAEVAEQIRDLEAKREAYDADATRLQDQLYAAEDGGTGDPEKLRVAMHRSLNAATAAAEKIRELQSPAEIQRRIQNRLDRQNSTERLTALRERNTMADGTPKTKKQNAADLGVPGAYVGPTGTFKVGMDARLKSDLILAILEQPAPKALVKFSKADAEKLFAKFPQWNGFLTRKQEILAAKATKQAERKTAAKARVSAKKTTGEAKPDPKPTARKRSTRKAKATA